MPVPTKTPVERFESKVARVDDGCWEWLAARFNTGYGCFWAGEMRSPRRPISVGAHRWSYEHFVGPIPEGMELDHLCRNRGCVNPEHLEPVTTRENLLRGVTLAAANARKTHCPDGHPYDDVNTYIDRQGRRTCKVCHRECQQRYVQRRKGTVAA